MFSRRRLALGIVLLLTTVSALLPPSASGWSNDVADILRVGQMPFARMGVALNGWLRPWRDAQGQPVDPATLEAVQAERDRLERLFRQERIRADELAARVRLLESLPDSALRAPIPPTTLSRAVTGRAVRDATARIELQPPDVGEDRLHVGDVVVASGRRLVGRLERATDLRLLVRPVAHPDTGPIEVALVRGADDTTRPLARILLQPDGRGTLRADVDRRVDVQVGDALMLTDPGWPARVQGLVVGHVQALEPIDAAPLRQRVVVMPAAPPQSIVQVAVVSTASEVGE
ncbi:MAG: hypothetical protein MK074_03105 [Phycisphaerales bacterium]|nr:hypothetical protein [Phycisphaerales bacterium]